MLRTISLFDCYIPLFHRQFFLDDVGEGSKTYPSAASNQYVAYGCVCSPKYSHPRRGSWPANYFTSPLYLITRNGSLAVELSEPLSVTSVRRDQNTFFKTKVAHSALQSLNESLWRRWKKSPSRGPIIHGDCFTCCLSGLLERSYVSVMNNVDRACIIQRHSRGKATRWWVYHNIFKSLERSLFAVQNALLKSCFRKPWFKLK